MSEREVNLIFIAGTAGTAGRLAAVSGEITGRLSGRLSGAVPITSS